MLNKLKTKESLMGAGSLFLIIASIAIVFALIIGIVAVSKSNQQYAGSKTISVTGEGEVTAIPDISTVGFTIRAEGKDMVAAQKVVTERGDAVIKALREKGIDEKDIKTDSYTSNPKYEWKQVACAGGFCPPGNQELVGYEVSHSLTVKIRDIDMTGDIVSVIGAQKVDSMYGPNFTIDDDRDVAAEAREAAIKDAKEKAEALADQLGVNLGKIVDFYENSNGYPVPMYKGGVAMDMMSARSEMAVAPMAPTLPVGENTVTSQVTITYRIK